MIFQKQDRISRLETRWVPDPWGLGVDFEIAHIGIPEYQNWIRENLRKSPLARKQIEVMQGIASLNAVLDDGSDLEDEDARKETAGLKARAIGEFVASQDLSFEFQARDLKGVALLIRDWRGEAEAYSPELAVEMLQLERDAERGHIYAVPGLELGEGKGALVIPEGTLLGQALAMWVLWEAGRTEEFRAAGLEEASGESVAS